MKQLMTSGKFILLIGLSLSIFGYSKEHVQMNKGVYNIITEQFAEEKSVQGGERQACSASFVMTGSGIKCGTGTFTVVDVTSAKINIGEASSGFMGAANDASLTAAKDIGALPAGKYRILLENDSKNTFRLHPLPGTQMNDRDGMLIHGFSQGQTRQEASRGCIILDANQRKELRKYFNECGELELSVHYQ